MIKIINELYNDDQPDIVINTSEGESFTNETIIKKLNEIDDSISDIEWELVPNGYGDGFKDFVVTTTDGARYSLRVYSKRYAFKYESIDYKVGDEIMHKSTSGDRVNKATILSISRGLATHGDTTSCRIFKVRGSKGNIYSIDETQIVED